MKKKFITNLALLIFLNLLIKPFWVFGIDRTIQNVVGSENYGFYFALFNLTLVLNIILDMGITNYNNKNIAQNNNILNKYLSNIIVLRFLLGIFYFIVVSIVGIALGYHFHEFKLLFILVVNQFLLSFISYLRSNLSGLLLFKTDSFISILDRSLMIIICSVLLWGNSTKVSFKIEWFAWAQFAAYFLTAFITFLIVLSKSKFLKIKFERAFLMVIIRQSFPYAMLTLLMSFYYRIDSVMIERLLNDGKIQAGIYAQAFRIMDAVSMIAFLFASLLLPLFAKMIKQRHELIQLTKFSFLLLITPSLILATGCFFYRNEIMNLLYTEHTESSSLIFSVLMFGYVFIANSYIFGTLLTANGSLNQLNIMAAIGMCINVVLNFILIPYYKALGAAIASLVTQLFTAIFQVLISKYIFKFSIRKKTAFMFAIFLSLIATCGYLSKIYIHNWYFGLIAFTALSLVIAVVLKLLDVFSIFKILKSD